MANRCLNLMTLVASVAFLSFPGAIWAGVDNLCYRPEFAMKGPLFLDNLKWGARLETIMKSDAREADCIALIGGLYWSPLDFLCLAPEYYDSAKGGTVQGNEQRIRLNAELSTKAGPLKLAWRNRFEYRMKEHDDNFWRYRSRFKVSFPKVYTVTPFVYEEPFYDFQAEDWNGNEAGVGFTVPLAKDLSVNIDCRTVNARKNGSWGDTELHLLTTFNYSF